MRVVLVRHGKQSEVGEDPSLTEVGRRQAELLSRRVAGFKPNRVFVSTLLRAQETYSACAEVLAGVPVVHSDRFVEISAVVIGGPKEPEETGIKADRERVSALYDELFSAKDVVMVFCHGNLIRALLAKVLGVQGVSLWDHLRVDHTSINVVESDEFGLVVERVNDTIHLQE